MLRGLLGGYARGRRQTSAATLSLNFLAGLNDSRITYSGGTNGTRVNSSGVIVAATTPRFDYNPVTHAARGLLVEESRTNLILNNTAMSTQNVTTAATPYTLSFYGTGTVTLSGTSTAGPLVGTGAYPNRVTLTFTPTAGTLTLTVTGSVEYAQLEAGSFATSVIINAGSALTRTADSAVMTGTNFSSWYNQSEGTFVFQYANAPTDVQRPVIIVRRSGDPNYRLQMDTALSYAIDAGAITSATGTGAAKAGAKIASAFKTDSFATSTNGGAVSADTSGANPNALDQMTIGYFDFGSGDRLNGHIQQITYYPRRSANEQLQALTA